MKAVILFIAVGYCALSCIGCNEYKSYDCHLSYPALCTYGYDSTEVDSIVVTAFEKDGTFSKKIRDTLITPPRYGYFRIGLDSFFISNGLSLLESHFDEYDWRYTVVFDGNSTEVSDIVRPRKTQKAKYEGAVSCISPVTQATINGKRVRNENGIEQIIIAKP